ncbi:MAG: hypothetical protein ACTTH5_02970 [Wolinella sp.]
MATQTVHNISYLINDEYALKEVGDKSLALANLPTGSVLLSCGVEVKEEADCASFELGSAEEPGLLITAGALNAKGYVKSEKNLQVQKDTTFYLKLSGSATKGCIAVRILYFTPSKYIVEY